MKEGLKYSPIRNKKCCICGKPVFANRSKYCRTCSNFAHRLSDKGLPAKTVKAVWDYVIKYGYVCYYTGMVLDREDPHSPWYCVFDHWHPHDPRKIVLTSSLINDMKSDLTEDEFWYMVRQLADHRRRHTRVRKKNLAYWVGDHTEILKMDLEVSQVHRAKCCLCGKPVFSVYSRYCRRCSKFAFRVKNKRFPPETVKGIFDYVRKNSYVCYYTGMRLDMDDPASPWYCVFDHWIPRNPGKIVITCSLVNFMKSDLTEDEFWYYIEALADYKDKGKEIRKKSPVFWNRLFPVDDVSLT